MGTQEISVDPSSAVLTLKVIRSWSGFITQLLHLLRAQRQTMSTIAEEKNNQYAHTSCKTKAILQVMLLTHKSGTEMKYVLKIES